VHPIHICEGYYLELFDGSIWAVKGCCHEGGRVAAVPRLVNGRKYKGYGEALEAVGRGYRSYLVRPSFVLREIPMIPLEDVRRVIPPSKKPQCAVDEGLGNAAEEVIEILDQVTGRSWYITGSLLYCAVGPGSDIDVISYDSDQKDLEAIHSLIEKGVFRRPTPREALEEALESSEGMGIETRVSKILRGISTLYYGGARITIKAFGCDPEKKARICSKKASVSSYRAILRVVARCDRGASPYLYRVEVLKALNNSLREGVEVYAYSHRARYSSLALGDVVICSGDLEIALDGERYINLDLGFCSIHG